MTVIKFPNPAEDWKQDVRDRMAALAEKLISGEVVEILTIARKPEKNAVSEIDIFSEEIPDFKLMLGMLESAKFSLMLAPLDLDDDDEDDYVQ